MELSDNLATATNRKTDSEIRTLPLNRVVHRSAADEVRAQLVGLIETGQLKVKDRLPSEAELSRRFGVSRPVVREALGRLQALGLTESRPGSGTFVASNVTKLTLSFGQYSAADLNEVRRCLDVPAARAAAERRTPADIEKLKAILDEHQHAATVEDVIKFDGQFHCAIAAATGNLLFERLLKDLQETLKEQTLAVSTLRNRGAGAAREHRAVLKAITDGDAPGAEAAMNEHLDAVERAIGRIPPDLISQHGAIHPQGAADLKPPTTGPLHPRPGEVARQPASNLQLSYPSEVRPAFAGRPESPMPEGEPAP
jgi:DNA-binding FadR family transcriptional regulator